MGNPYVNFGLSALVEFFGVSASHFALERYGRKVPYAINMCLTGVSLIFVIFIPSEFESMVTVCALIGKFSISFTYNTIYIITAESHPTVIRNSVISICESFSGLGAIIAPNVQLLVKFVDILLIDILYFFFLKGSNVLVSDSIHDLWHFIDHFSFFFYVFLSRD